MRRRLRCALGALAWATARACRAPLRSLDLVTAKTTIRLWHELHVARRIAHDYGDLLAPTADAVYVGLVRHDELKSIALCRPDADGYQVVRRIAYAPSEQSHGVELLRRASRHDREALRAQPVFYCESLLLQDGAG